MMNESGGQFMEKDSGVIYDEMKDLRNKTSGEESVFKFKKNVFGGIKEKDVEDYITSINQQFNRSEAAYKDRIDEFATHTEMLVNERDDALLQLQKRIEELGGLRTEIEEQKNKIAALQKTMEENNLRVIEFDANELNELKIAMSEEKIKTDALQKVLDENNQRFIEIEVNELERIKKEETNINLAKENELLKNELFEILETRDKLAGENAVIKKQIMDFNDLLVIVNKDKSELQDNIASIRSTIRQNEMRKSMVLSEYTEKQIYKMNQTTQNMKEMLSSVENMKNDVCELFVVLKENKVAENIQNYSFSNNEEIELNS